MARFRKTTKYGSRTVTQGTGGTTTSYSSGSTMKNGRGTRRTVTTKSNGQRYIRTTEGSGGGYYRTTQKSLNPTRSRGLKRSSSKDPFKITSKDWDSLSDGGSLLGDIASLFGSIANLLTSDKNDQQPTTNKVESTEVVDQKQYKYKLQYSSDGNKWLYCQSQWDTCTSLQQANERLTFKQKDSQVNKYRIVRIDENGMVEDI